MHWPPRALLALGLSRLAKAPVVVVPPPPVRMADRTGDVLTAYLAEAGAWRFGAQLSLVRDGSRLTVRVFLRDLETCEKRGRDERSGEAANVRAVLTAALQAEGYVVVFADALWNERERRGWEVVVKAKELIR